MSYHHPLADGIQINLNRFEAPKITTSATSRFDRDIQLGDAALLIQ